MDRDAALRWTDELYDLLRHRQPDVEKAHEYYEGNQPLAFASKEWQTAHADRYAGFSDNWCAPVADAPVERLIPQGLAFQAPPGRDATADDVAAADAVLRDLWRRVWQENELDAEAPQAFIEAGVAKRAHAIVWSDGADGVQVTFEDAATVIVGYDPANRRRRVAALQVWTADGWEYATLYEPDNLWKWQRKAAANLRTDGVTQSGLFIPSGIRSSLSGGRWEPREVDGEPWPLPNPLGVVPVVELPNRPRLGKEPLSDIAGTMAMQDAINLLWAYLFTSADHASMPARVVTGQDIPKLPILDDKGQKVGERPVRLEDLAQGRLLWLTGTDAKIDQWDAAKLDVFTAVIEIAVGHIAAQTRTPPHYLVANKGLANLSGDALKAAETGLVKKVQAVQAALGPRLREILYLGALVLGDRQAAEAARRSRFLWGDAENRSDSQRSDALLKKRQIGYPFEYLLQQDGLTRDEIQAVMAMKQREAEMAALAGTADLFAGTDVPDLTGVDAGAGADDDA